jgi:hypothetical protein
VSPRHWALVASLACVALGCETDKVFVDHQDAPTDVAVLPGGAFFDGSVAVVANSGSGAITKLDLERFYRLDDTIEGLPLVERPARNPFEAAPPLAAGRGRRLDRIALATDGLGYVDVIATDVANFELLSLPWFVREGSGDLRFHEPTPPNPDDLVVRAPVGSPEIDVSALRVRPGRTTTERWTLVWDAERNSYAVEGSASGPQRARALPGVWYETDGGELGLQIEHGGSVPPDGTELELLTDSQLRSLELPGWPGDVEVVHDGRWAVTPATDLVSGDAWLVVVDLEAMREELRLALPPGSVPERSDWVADAGLLLVSDSGSSGLLHVADLSDPDPAGWILSALAVGRPSFDVALARDGSDLVYLADPGSNLVHVADLDSGVLVDAAPFSAAVDPIRLPTTLVQGLGASTSASLLRTEDAAGRRERSHVIGAVGSSGELFLIRSDLSCLVSEDRQGATVGDMVGVTAFLDTGPISDPILASDPVTGEVATLSRCGGLVEAGWWTFTYDEFEHSYRVRAGEAGDQETRAVEDQRYISDNGGLSVLIRSGTRSTTDGDRFQVRIDDGVSGMAVGEAPIEVEFFDLRPDVPDTGWAVARPRPVALVPAPGNDTVTWIDIENFGAIDPTGDAPGPVHIYH